MEIALIFRSSNFEWDFEVRAKIPPRGNQALLACIVVTLLRSVISSVIRRRAYSLFDNRSYPDDLPCFWRFYIHVFAGESQISGSARLLKNLEILSLPRLVVVLSLPIDFSTVVDDISLKLRLDPTVFTMYSPLSKGLGIHVHRQKY